MTLVGLKKALFRHFNSIFVNNQCRIDSEVTKRSMNTLGERIAYLRKKNKISQTALMKQLKFNNLGKYELNERLPKLDVIISLAQYFNVTTDWLLIGSEGTLESDTKSLNQDIKNNQFKKQHVSSEDLYFLSLYHKLTSLQQAKVEGYIEGLLGSDHPIQE